MALIMVKTIIVSTLLGSKNYPNAAFTWNIVPAAFSIKRWRWCKPWLVIRIFSKIWIISPVLQVFFFLQFCSFSSFGSFGFRLAFFVSFRRCAHLLQLFHCFVPAKLQDLRQFEFGSNFACYPPFPPRNILFAGFRSSAGKSSGQNIEFMTKIHFEVLFWR